MVLRFDEKEDPHTLYVELPGYHAAEPGPDGSAAKSLRLHEVLGSYEGPDVIFDFDENGVMIGIEVLADGPDE